MNKISVIIPYFNNQDTIKETLDSFVFQTYQNFEIIIVDDGSKDKSKLFLETLKEQYSIQIFYQKNSGPSVARNFGSEKSCGEFLLFIDADDKIHSTYLAKCVNEFNNNSKLKIVYANARFFDNVNKDWKLSEVKLPDFLLYNCIHICSLIKKSTFIEMGKFDTELTFTEDWDLWIRIIKKFGIESVYRLPETLFFYRKRKSEDSLTDIMDVNNMSEKSRLYIYNKHYDFYKANDLGLITLNRI